jgi:hypothetical protein
MENEKEHEGNVEIHGLIESIQLQSLRNGFRIACIMMEETMGDVMKDPQSDDLCEELCFAYDDFIEKYALMQNEQLEAVIMEQLTNRISERDG